MNQGRGNNHNQKRSRKRRKNFHAKEAKKHVKKDLMRRGTQISDELYQYFMGILDVMKKGIENEGERQTLVNKVLERTKGEELNISGNQLGRRVLELLLPFASVEDLERFMETFSSIELRELCSDIFTSHVIQAILKVACDRATLHLQNQVNNQSDSEEIPKKKSKGEGPRYEEDHIKKCHEFTLKISEYVFNNLEEFVWDEYANYIIRTALKCLSGITSLPGQKPQVNMFKTTVDDGKGIPHPTTMTYKIVPEEFREIVKDCANRISAWPQLKEMPYQFIPSGLLHVLMYAVKNVDEDATKVMVRQLLDESFAPKDWVPNGGDDKKDVKNADEESKVPTANLPPVFKSESSVRLLEACLFVAKKETYTQIYTRCFINHLGQLATMRMLNFTVQRLIDNCEVKEQFEPIFEELSDKTPAVLASGNTGVLVALARACLRLEAKQEEYINSLEAAFKCTEEEKQKYFSVACLRLLPLDKVDLTRLDKNYFINVNGSVILQCILDFQNPAKAVNSLLELSAEQLMVIMCDTKGCHVADVLCKGQFVGVKDRDKLVWRLKGYYQKLAISQYGSRALEQIFAVCTPEQRVEIMSELAVKSNLLQSTPCGRILADKLDVATFQRAQDTWEANWTKKQNN